MHAPSRSRLRGVTLVEAVVALTIVAFTALALMKLHATLQRGAELSRLRATATDLAQQRLETARSFVMIEGSDEAPGFDQMRSAEESLDTPDMPSTFDVSSTVRQGAHTRHKTIDVAVAWTDRAGQTHQAELSTMLARIEPVLGALLLLPDSTTHPTHLQQRHPGIPVTATDTGKGRSIHPLPGAENLHLVFDNTTGEIVSRCDADADTEDLPCEGNVRGLYLGGHVEFFTPDAVDAAESVKELDVRLLLTSAGHPATAYECHDDSSVPPRTGRRHVAYGCVIFFEADAPKSWSGRSTVSPVGEGWGPAPAAWGTTGDRFRLCRFSADHDGDGLIGKHEHPSHYLDVTSSLSNQNFLVLPGDSACPAGTVAALPTEDGSP